MVSDILAVVVLYNEELFSTQTYQSLLLHRPDLDLFIWDNSKVCQDIDFEPNRNAVYVHSIENKGVSYAYNKAYEYACSNNYKWMLLLDQDTCFDSSYLSVLEQNVIKNPCAELFSPVHRLSNGFYLSPVRCYFKFSHLSKHKFVGNLKIKKYAIINSGMLINVSLFGVSGGYKNEVFLDYSDFQFLERVSRYCKYIISIDSVCVQRFSNNELNFKKMINRYELFCKSLRACEKRYTYDYLIYFIIVFKRCLALIIKFRSFMPIRVFYYSYIKSFSL